MLQSYIHAPKWLFLSMHYGIIQYILRMRYKMPIITTDLYLAISKLKQGQPVAIPTETVYGLAAMIDNEPAIKAVYAMKKRPLSHPLIVHVAKDWDLSAIVDYIPDYARVLIQQFWPGPLTLVLNSKENAINPLITGGQTTVAIRCPAHPLAQALLHNLGAPVVAPSANPFGKISPTTAEHVKKSFDNEELIILDGGRCTVGIESTIIDATHKDYYQILRHGLIDQETIEHLIPIDQSNEDNPIRVPGKLASHYMPQKPLYYFPNHSSLEHFCMVQANNTYVIASKKPASVSKELFHEQAKDPVRAAYELYYQLREADDSKATSIAIELPPNTSEWQGIRERIMKAGLAYPE